MPKTAAQRGPRLSRRGPFFDNFGVGQGLAAAPAARLRTGTARGTTRAVTSASNKYHQEKKRRRGELESRPIGRESELFFSVFLSANGWPCLLNSALPSHTSSLFPGRQHERSEACANGQARYAESRPRRLSPGTPPGVRLMEMPCLLFFWDASRGRTTGTPCQLHSGCSGASLCKAAGKLQQLLALQRCL